MFDKVYARDRTKEHTAARRLDRADYFTLLECLGLAAWRDNLRTGSQADFDALRKLHPGAAQRKRLDALPEAGLENVALLFYTRPDVEGRGFEFIHKSFGEYLAARGLLAAGLRAAKLLTEGEEPRTAPEIAWRWTELISQAELTDEILRFLVDEARLRDPHSIEDEIPPLAEVFQWSWAHGMPAHEVFSGLSWRACETRQRCAESALLAVIDAMNRARRSADSEAGAIVAVNFSLYPDDFYLFLHRLGPTCAVPAARALGCLNLSGLELSGANLGGANLSGANLSGVDLYEAGLNGADLSGADLSGANLRRVDLFMADLSRANLQSADLTDWKCVGTSLRSVDFRRSRNLSAASVISAFGVRSGFGATLLPPGMEPPAHWHVAEDAEMDSLEAQARYKAALAAFRAGLAQG